MTSPAPLYGTSIFPFNLPQVDGQTVIGTHAPNSLYFQPPAGASHIRAVGGLLSGAYTGEHYTDGVNLQVWESLPDGNQQLLFERPLFPHDHLEDRAEVTLDITMNRPFVGVVYLRVDPGPAGQINFDWVYWRSIKIY